MLSSQTPTEAVQPNPLDFKNKLTTDEKKCIERKLGVVKTLQLIKEIQRTKQVPQDVIPIVNSCLPSSMQLPVFPTLSPGTQPNVYSGYGLVLGAGVMIQQMPQLCQEVQKYGSKFDWLTLSWSRIQPKAGQWDYSQFDSWVDGYRACGQQVGVHILSDAPWATQPAPQTSGNHKPSMPAKNMQDYYDFVYNVASHYKGKIARYSIENEAHASQNWGGTPQQYFEELQTAYKAIHAGDPNAIVEDAAMSHEGLGYLTTSWLYKKGETQQAMDFCNSYDLHFQRNSQSLKCTGVSQLQEMINSSTVRHLIQWETMLFQNHAYYDHMQIHIGTTWQDLQTVFTYLHTNLQAQGADKPLDLWEGWYGWWGAPGNGFDPLTQAKDVVKQAVTAFANNVTVYNYWLFNDYTLQAEGHVGLVDNQGSPRPAAYAYKTMSEKLTGSTSVQQIPSGSNIYEYKFSRNGKNIYVVWSIVPATVPSPFQNHTSVTDIRGNTKDISGSQISVSDSPVFIEE